MYCMACLRPEVIGDFATSVSMEIDSKDKANPYVLRSTRKYLANPFHSACPSVDLHSHFVFVFVFDEDPVE